MYNIYLEFSANSPLGLPIFRPLDGAFNRGRRLLIEGRGLLLIFRDPLEGALNRDSGLLMEEGWALNKIDFLIGEVLL